MRGKPSPERTPAESRDAVSAAFKAFEERRRKKANETTTRVELIDELLSAVGWSTGSIERELPTGTGDFIDYELQADGHPWMVVEAKRAGQSFRLVRNPAKPGRGMARLGRIVERRMRDAGPWVKCLEE